jgi:hypothetical protein
MSHSHESIQGIGPMTCIFDLLRYASKNVRGTREFLSFMDLTIQFALNSTIGVVHKQLEKLVITMILKFGEERSEYKNHFAEFAVVAKLLLEGGFKLEAVEKILPNGNSMDFEVSKNNIHTLIEVYNIDFKIERICNSENLVQFLENRLLSKFNDKFEGIERIDIGCYFVPVLWGDIVSLINFEEAFIHFKDSDLIGPFMMVAQYRDQVDGHVIYQFDSVEQFLARVEHRSQGN